MAHPPRDPRVKKIVDVFRCSRASYEWQQFLSTFCKAFATILSENYEILDKEAPKYTDFFLSLRCSFELSEERLERMLEIKQDLDRYIENCPLREKTISGLIYVVSKNSMCIESWMGDDIYKKFCEEHLVNMHPRANLSEFDRNAYAPHVDEALITRPTVVTRRLINAALSLLKEGDIDENEEVAAAMWQFCFGS